MSAIDNIDLRLRRVLQFCQVAAVIAFFSGSFQVQGISSEEAHFNQTILPIMSFCSLLLSLLGFNKKIRLHTYGLISMGFLAAFLVVKTYVTLFVLPMVSDFIHHLQVISPWFAPVMIGTFVFMDRGAATVLGYIFSFSLAATVGSYLYRNQLLDPSTPAFTVWIQQYVLGLPVVTFTLSAFARIKENLYRARLRELHLEHLSLTDDLTQLGNRRALEALMNRDLARFRRSQKPFSILIFDIDYFKKVNDVHGHKAGDDVLRSVGHLLQTQMRSSEWCGRWGGEEFLVGIEGNILDATKTAERLRKAIEALNSAGVPRVTASFGVAEARLDESSDEIVKRADSALYKAKASGRNCVRTQELDAPGSK
jgi:diguanylate cyclase (GGDEF)-like protein